MGEWVNDADIRDFWEGHAFPIAQLEAAGCPDTNAAWELAALMSKISEDHYAAGWLQSLEYSLFSTAFEGTGFGDGLSPQARGGLIELARRCDGWWTYGEKGPKFHRMEVWTEIYKSL